MLTHSQGHTQAGAHYQLPCPLNCCPFAWEQPFADACEQCAAPRAVQAARGCGTITQGCAAGLGPTPPASPGPSRVATQALSSNGDGHIHTATARGLCESRQAHVKAQQELPLRYATLPPAGVQQGLRVPPHPQDPWVPPFPRLLGKVKAWRTWLPGGLGEEHVGLTAFPSLLRFGFDRSSVIRLNTQPRLTIC